MRRKKTLVFIDHSYHKKTRSTVFFVDILKKDFNVTRIWDYSWRGGRGVDVSILNNFDYLIFFQVLPEYPDLLKINKPIIWVPMYDSETTNPFLINMTLYYKLLATFPIKVISFSKKLHLRMIKLGFDGIYIQYYPDPNKFQKVTYERKKILFWDRGDISFDDVKTNICDQKIESTIIKIDRDPSRNNMMPSGKDIKKYNIQVMNGHCSKAMYRSLLSKTNIYIAPRRQEGIGMSFLEALASGHCVVAHNNATMNEYIVDRKNGLLTKYWKKTIDLRDYSNIGKNARNKAKRGYKKWNQQKSEIIGFIQKVHYARKEKIVKKQVYYRLYKFFNFIFKSILNK